MTKLLIVTQKTMQRKMHFKYFILHATEMQNFVLNLKFVHITKQCKWLLQYACVVV
jgi:hypothetical protein